MDALKRVLQQRGGKKTLAAVVALVVAALAGCGRNPAEPPHRPPPGPATGPQPADTQPPTAQPSGPQEPGTPSPIGQRLYAQHCAGCHGTSGDGQGPAAAFLFPKPRDFRQGRFRLVSTQNRVPSRRDLEDVLLRGMPGSAMPPWPQLSEAERGALVDEVLRIRRDAARELYIRLLKEEQELTDAELAAPQVQQEIADFVQRMTTPGETTPVPEYVEPTPESIARGKQWYASAGCLPCHGPQGRGDGVQQMFDDEKLPTTPRDFVRGIFKGGDDFASLYRRIAYGMPGTPMPSATQLSSQQMLELVHYILSLSDEPTRRAAVLTRERIVAVRMASLPQSPEDTAWQQAPTSVVRLTPLWWRSDFDPQREVVYVQAAHDGATLVLRLSWPDATPNADATASEAFEDGIAVALHDAAMEPFLAMGGSDTPVSVWYWDADRQHDPDVFARYQHAAVDWYPLQEGPVDTAEFQRPAAAPQHVPPLLAPPRATGNRIVPPGSGNGASELAARGPGTIGFRPASPAGLIARGVWSAQRWTVQMTGPLDQAAAAEAARGTGPRRLIAALAVWDGAHRDRDGQKLISIWQDLELRP